MAVFLKQLPTYLLGALITQAIPVFTLPILTRHLQPAEYGTLVLVQAVGMFSASFFSLGLTNTFERNFFDRYEVGEKRYALFWSAIAGNTALGILGGLMFALACPVIETTILKTTVTPYFIGTACV